MGRRESKNTLSMWGLWGGGMGGMARIMVSSIQIRRRLFFKVGLEYGAIFTVESGSLYRVCFLYARWSVDKIQHS